MERSGIAVFEKSDGNIYRIAFCPRPPVIRVSDFSTSLRYARNEGKGALAVREEGALEMKERALEMRIGFVRSR